VAPGIPHHVTQRGNRRQQTFFSDDDYRAYLELLAQWCSRCAVEIWAYCLMPNHVHLMILLFLLLNIAGKSVAKYLDTSLDWADNNEKWNSQKIRPGNKVLKESSVSYSDQAHLTFQSLKEGSPYKNDESHLNEENKIL